MRIAHYSPLVLAALFVLRVAACGNGKPLSSGTGGSSGTTGAGGSSGTTGAGGSSGTTGAGGSSGASGTGLGGAPTDAGPLGGSGGRGGSGSVNPPAPSGTCVGGGIMYGTSADAGAQTHACANNSCSIDVATGSASCRDITTAGEPPFRTCRSAADCGGATYCAAFGDRSETLLGGATCVNGVCDWTTPSQQACGAGEYCYPSGCKFYTSSTSGGFPWNPGGTGGSAGGSTSGGFPWGNGGGGGGGATGSDAATSD